MNPSHDHAPTRSAALKIAAVYAFLGAVWILCSGWLLHHFVHDQELAAELEDVKGWFYVLVTASLLGWWLDRYFRQIRKATELLQKSETRFVTIFKDSPIAITITRLRDGVFVDVNEAFTQLNGYPREEIIGRTSEQLRLWHSSNHEQVIAELLEKATIVVPLQVRNNNGDVRDLSAYFQLIELDGETCILGTLVDVTERKRSETALRESEERFRSLIEGAPEAVFVQCAGTFRYVNQAMLKLMKAERPEELLGLSFLERILPEYHDVVRQRIQAQHETGVVAPPMEQEFLCLDGTQIPVETTAVSIRFQGQDGHLVFVRDITGRRKAVRERMNLEEQLQQAQKMEFVGRLAGGVAHDFNNLLMGIMGYTELCRNALENENPACAYLDGIMDAAERSAGITRQLLAFARKQTIAPVLIELNEHVEATLKLLRRLVGEEVELVWNSRAQDAWVKMDPSQVDQILANLAVNARDAIDGVGKLTIETGNASFDSTFCAEHEGAVPGEYVMLAVSDSGCGMDPETLVHIFEPFYTTKPVGKGTGLGLATIYGIVKQNEGYLNVDSEQGKGTTFQIYLPHHAHEAGEAKGTGAPRELPGGTETIMLVEDEKSVRITTGLLLQSLGYTVLSAADPDDALCQAEEHSGVIHLLITDVILPGMNGRDLATKLSEMQPRLVCLYISGYTADVIAHHGILEEGIHFLAKPFSRDALANKVREVLKGRRHTETH